MALLSQRNQNKHLKQLDFHYHPTLGGSGRSIDGEEPPEFDFLTLECDPAVLKQPEAKKFPITGRFGRCFQLLAAPE